MAGEIERYISPSVAFEMKPAQSTHYHDKSLSAKNTLNIMEEYLSNEVDENVLLDLLSSDMKRGQALHYLDKHLHENNSILIFHDKQALFKGFALALSDPNQKICIQCTKLIAKIIPQLGNDLDSYMHKVISKMVSNVGNQSVTLQKESIQTLHVYMKHSTDVDRILRIIAQDGIQHNHPRIRQQIIHTFPTLLFNEFKSEDFFDVVHSLVGNLAENQIEKEVIMQTLDKVKNFVGKVVFSEYINRLPTPLRHTYNKNQSSPLDSNRLSDTNLSRILVHSKVSDDTAVLMDKDVAERELTNFSKSGHLESSLSRRNQGNGMYSSLPILPSYDAPKSLSEHQSVQGDENQLPFISKHIMEQLSSPELSVRLSALEEVKAIFYELEEYEFSIRKNILSFVSLLQPMLDDKNFRVSCYALKVLGVLISRVGPYIDGYLRLFVLAVSKKLGNTKPAVRAECMKIFMQLMEVAGRKNVLDLCWSKFTHKQYRVREDMLCVVIAMLLNIIKAKDKIKDLVFDEVCKHVTSLLTDPQSTVRKAALDCVAVLGHILGTTSKQLLSAVDSVELKNDNATGVMPAVHARLMRKQLPRLNENMLVEYAVFPPSTAPMTSPQGADLQWIIAAEKSKKIAHKGLYAVADNDLNHSFQNDMKRSIENIAPDVNIPHHPRRHVSAGKQRQFPWASQDDPLNSKHPSSAPVNSVKYAVEKQPPFRPRNTWGPESEISQFPSGAVQLPPKSKSMQGYKPTTENGSYQEIHKRKKEAQAGKPLMGSSFSSSHSRSDSGYMPSFASSVSSASTPNNSYLQDANTLSSSCPSTFFEKNSGARPVMRRSQRKAMNSISQNNDSSPSSAYGTEDSDSPIIVKPKLARSASKRRDNAVASSRDSLKVDDPSDKVPVKLKNTSASPRFDRLISNISNDQKRSMLKTHQNSFSSHGAEKFPGPSFNDDSESSSSSTSISTTGYTPSGIQKSLFKDPPRSEQVSRNSSVLDKDPLPTKYNQLTNGNNNSNKPNAESTRDKPQYMASRPIVPSNFSPARHRSHDDNTEFQSNAVSSIRRSAQNKRERMRSQPGSDESFNSFSELNIETSHVGTKLLSNDIQTEQLQTNERLSQSAASNELTGTSNSPIITEPPPFKYNPNTGVTFDPKKVDTDVSVVGIRYPGQVYPAHSSSSLDIRVSQPSPISATSSVSSMSLPGAKYSPSNTSTHDRHRPHRGSSTGIASSSVSPDSASTSFNIQGKGVFMTTSSTSLMSANESMDRSPTPTSKEELRSKSISNSNSTSAKFLDGVCGVAVRQPSLTPDELSGQFDFRRQSETEMSMSASLRQKQKDAISTKSTYSVPKPRFQDIDTSPTILKHRTDRTDDILSESPHRSSTDTRSKSNKTLSPLRVSGSSHRGMYDKEQGLGSAINKLLPLDNPEKGLVDAITALEVNDSEAWEVLTHGMYTIRRLATYHPNVLAPRFRDVVVLLCKNVSSLRSQVSKTSIQAITDVYTNLKKPIIDTDIETTVRVLLSEHGKSNTFIRDEINKTLTAIVGVATSSKILNALLNAGLRHKNKSARNLTAKFCWSLVEKMGPGKCLSGIKDITDRLLEAVAVFVADVSPDVRYYGRLIVNELMVHEDFNRCIERYLSSKNAAEVKGAANSIKQRGLGSISSVGARKMAGSVRKKNGSSSASPGSSSTSERFSPTSQSAHSRRKVAGAKIFNEQEHEEVKRLCNDLSNGNFAERKLAIANVHEKWDQDRRFVEDNIVKIMDAFISMLSTAQTKLNHIGLSALPDLLVKLHPLLRDVLPNLVPAVFKLLLSKQYGDLALKDIEIMIQYVEHSWIIKPIASIAQYGTAKSKQTAIIKLIELIESLSRKKGQNQLIERHVFPVLRTLVSAQRGPSGVQLRRETSQLTQTLYNVLGQKLLDFADTNNMLAGIKDMLTESL